MTSAIPTRSLDTIATALVVHATWIKFWTYGKSGGVTFRKGQKTYRRHTAHQEEQEHMSDNPPGAQRIREDAW